MHYKMFFIKKIEIDRECKITKKNLVKKIKIIYLF